MNRPGKFIFVPLGSAGDVNPIVWLARLMADRGHETVVVIQEVMADYPRRAGLRTIPTGDARQQEAVARDPRIWHPYKAFPILAREFVRAAEEMIPAIRAELGSRRTVLVGAGIAFGARILSELEGLPFATVHLQPCILMSPHDSPVLKQGMERLKKRPLWVRQCLFRLGYFFTDLNLRRPINRLRSSYGLRQPVKRIMDRWSLSPYLTLALFPEWFAPRQPDWDPHIVATRFPLYDESQSRPLAPGLERFLAEGPSPVLITPGSVNMHACEFIREAVDAVRTLGRRALVITPFPDQLPELPPGSTHYDFAAFGSVFPRCALVIHHGGIGTCAQALAGGVPQLIMPMAHDQPDNAWRIRNLSAGDYLFPRQWKSANIAEKARKLLASDTTRRACDECRERMARQMKPEGVTALLERLLPDAIEI